MRLYFLWLLLIPLFVLNACASNNNQTLSIDTTDFAFTPNQWTVNAGQRITLKLTNQSGSEHEWVLLKKGEEVTMPFDADDEARIEFESEVEPGNVKISFFPAPDEAGLYRIVCGIPGHLEAGMEGTLTVK